MKTKPGLAALISPVTIETFLGDYWPGRPLVSRLSPELLAEISREPYLTSLDSLLGMWPYQVQAHLPDLADEASSVDASPIDARKLFNNRMGLLFNQAQRISPLLREWLEAIHSDLGLPAMTYRRCLIYATPSGKGTAPHFDQNINFVLQIHGTKKWRLAPNESVQNPMQRHTMGHSVDPELETYLEAQLPTEMPTTAEEVTLTPDSLLFVPRGYWHSTEAEGEALALNFTFSQPTWVDLMTAALRSRLSLSAEWRELADGASSKDPERREIAKQKFDLLLLELTHDLPYWRAGDILGSTEGY